MAQSVELVPFLDLGRAHRPLASTLSAAFDRIVESGAFIDGPEVAEFEQAFASYTGTGRCVGMASGLDALRLGFLAAGIELGDEVIVPAMTFVATLEAVTQAGGKPVLADIGVSDRNLDPDATAAAITPRTRFVMPVHLYGQLADMERINALGPAVIEDACQAHGAERDGFRAGACGAAAGFSFYPGKNLGAMGDAGALVTDDEAVADLALALRQHGQRRKYHHDLEGYTARLDTIQAAILLEKLSLLDGWNDERRAAARLYLDGLVEVGDLVLPAVPEGSNPVWHLFVVHTTDPAALAASLLSQGIQTGRHYPSAVHQTGAYAHLGYGAGAFPVAEEHARTCLSLPIFPGILDSEIERVVDGVKSFFADG